MSSKHSNLLSVKEEHWLHPSIIIVAYSKMFGDHLLSLLTCPLSLYGYDFLVFYNLIYWLQGENDQALDISLAQQHSDICTNITIK